MKRFLIKILQKWLNALNKKPSEPKVLSGILTSLAPKILENEKDLQRIKFYLDALKNAINNDDIFNIALTGAYGSGKSTIIKTFQHQNQDHKYLNISLASFKENPNDEEKLERKLEISILQQIFYHVKPSQIPDSRFKRIINVTNKKLWGIAVSLILWLVSTIILFKFNYINKLDPSTWHTNKGFDFYFLILLLIFCSGIGLFSKTIVRLFSNSKISKLNIKGELELGDNIDKSVFNQHLEEILYFFERTDFNVVVIEDLDRFDNTDIFTKLREINILLNNSTVINRQIKFIYAVRDEVFNDKNERVKFFEFIIPVIPFINPSNAGDQLTKLIADAKLENVLSKEFTEDVVTFIDDIDMRLLINIFHEYCLYRENLSKELNQDELFSMIVYKNMFPDDFGELSKRRGKLYKFISDKSLYTQETLGRLTEEISEIKNRIKIIEAEWIPTIKELRTIYISRILEKLPAGLGASLYTTQRLSSIEAIKDENFSLICLQPKIKYSFFHHSYSATYTLQDNHSAAFSFGDVEKEISNDSYKKREKNISDKSKVETLRAEIQKKISTKDEIESYSLKQIFEEEDIEPYLIPFTDTPLLRSLFLNGYLNENYSDYISLFHEGNLAKEDFDFEKRIKSGLISPYDYKLIKIENLIKKINIKYFERDSILNHSLLDFILSNQVQYKDQHDFLFKLLSSEKEGCKKFIVEYIDRGEQLPEFIKSLCKHWDNFWNFICENDFTQNRKNEFLILILKCADVVDIKKYEQAEHNIVLYIESDENIFEILELEIEKKLMITLINQLEIIFDFLPYPKDIDRDIFDFIYKENHYEITERNIETVLKVFAAGIDITELSKSNYTTIISSKCDALITYIKKNIDFYVEFTLLDISENTQESEKSIIELLNNEELKIDLKNELIEKQYNYIKDIESVNELQAREFLLYHNKAFPSWHNVFAYYKKLPENVFDETLILFLNEEDNYNELSNSLLNTEGNSEEFINEFCLKMIYCEDLSYQSYISLIKSIPHTYNDLELEEISDDKVTYLVESQFLNMTLENFDSLKANHEPLHILLLEKNYHKFLELFATLSLTEADIFELLSSTSLSINNKVDLLKKLDTNIIVSNKSIAKSASSLIADNTISLSFDAINSCFNSTTDGVDKIKIINRYFDSLSVPQIQSFIESLGEEYTRMFIKKKRPVFSNNPFHVELFSNLERRNMIIRFEPYTNHGDELRVYANY